MGIVLSADTLVDIYNQIDVAYDGTSLAITSPTKCRARVICDGNVSDLIDVPSTVKLSCEYLDVFVDCGNVKKRIRKIMSNVSMTIRGLGIEITGKGFKAGSCYSIDTDSGIVPLGCYPSDTSLYVPYSIVKDVVSNRFRVSALSLNKLKYKLSTDYLPVPSGYLNIDTGALLVKIDIATASVTVLPSMGTQKIENTGTVPVEVTICNGSTCSSGVIEPGKVIVPYFDKVQVGDIVIASGEEHMLVNDNGIVVKQVGLVKNRVYVDIYAISNDGSVTRVDNPSSLPPASIYLYVACTSKCDTWKEYVPVEVGEIQSPSTYVAFEVDGTVSKGSGVYVPKKMALVDTGVTFSIAINKSALTFATASVTVNGETPSSTIIENDGTKVITVENIDTATVSLLAYDVEEEKAYVYKFELLNGSSFIVPIKSGNANIVGAFVEGTDSGGNTFAFAIINKVKVLNIEKKGTYAIITLSQPVKLKVTDGENLTTIESNTISIGYDKAIRSPIPIMLGDAYLHRVPTDADADSMTAHSDKVIVYVKGFIGSAEVTVGTTVVPDLDGSLDVDLETLASPLDVVSAVGIIYRDGIVEINKAIDVPPAVEISKTYNNGTLYYNVTKYGTVKLGQTLFRFEPNLPRILIKVDDNGVSIKAIDQATIYCDGKVLADLSSNTEADIGNIACSVLSCQSGNLYTLVPTLVDAGKLLPKPDTISVKALRPDLSIVDSTIDDTQVATKVIEAYVGGTLVSTNILYLLGIDKTMTSVSWLLDRPVSVKVVPGGEAYGDFGTINVPVYTPIYKLITENEEEYSPAIGNVIIVLLLGVGAGVYLAKKSR